MLILATFRSEYEYDYEYEFSVLSTRCRFKGRNFRSARAQNLKLVLVVDLVANIILCLAMDDFSPEWEDDFVKIEMKELQREIDVSGVTNIKEFLRKRLERWREVKVNIAITGDSGSGKSSFINAIRE